MKTAEQVQDLITPSDSPWCEFENNFEEGWTDNPRMVSVTNIKHHKDISNRVANILSIIYESEEMFWEENPEECGETILSSIYSKVAKAIYPEDKVWTGDMANAPEFWAECHKENKTHPEKRIETLWFEK